MRSEGEGAASARARALTRGWTDEAMMHNPGNGIILDMSTLQPKRVLLNWRFVPVAVVPLQENMILAFNPKMIDVFAKSNGEIIQVLDRKRAGDEGGGG